eukprot:gnl/TRDRNA2_/TRDRNA2_72441_c2_seq1.p1 gnl/TRDRNA2_/TRDRNA2_72441_c2~~gnl/TRDRNA2_/TRDRNA2_72441_c2_seq1.p1  ORF type:complete len:408 (+),score=32.43 gnl/TRDRNA2_/TRDRNA2_72441_c2_seq1:84-1226(+)
MWGSHKVCKTEFERALSLVGSDLRLDELRKKVRQRFRSIREVFLDQEQEDGTRHINGHAEKYGEGLARAETDSRPASRVRPGSRARPLSRAGIANELAEHLPARYLTMLEQVELSESELRCLFDLIDFQRKGSMAFADFALGVQLLSMASIFQDLRVSCLNRHACVADAFADIGVSRRGEVLDVEGLRRLLQDVDLASGVDVELLFDLLESRSQGGVRVGELISALQCACPGHKAQMASVQRDRCVRQQVRGHLAPFVQTAGALRLGVRALGSDLDKDKEPHDIPTGSVRDPWTYERTSDGRSDHGTNPAAAGLSRWTAAPPCSEASLARTRCSKGRVHTESRVGEKLRGSQQSVRWRLNKQLCALGLGPDRPTALHAHF